MINSEKCSTRNNPQQKKIENRLYELHPIPIFYRKMKWKIQGKSVSWINDDYYETISIMSAKIKKR